MMPWKAVLAGALGGAIIAFALMFAVSSTGRLPISDARLRYMMAHPELLTALNDRFVALQDEEQNALQDASAAAIRKIGPAPFFDPRIAFVTDPANAKNTFVEMYDYDCPFCRASRPTVMKFYQAHKNDTRFAFLEFPLPSHGPGAILAARASLAARRQPDKYVAMHFALMGSEGRVDEAAIIAAATAAGMDIEKLKADMKEPGLEKILTESKALAERAGISWTPAFIINGVAHAGVLDDKALATLTGG